MNGIALTVPCKEKRVNQEEGRWEGGHRKSVRTTKEVELIN